MTGMGNTIEQVAEAIRRTREFQAGAAFGVPEDAHEDYALGVARALHAAGLLAPTPLPNSGAGWYEVIHPAKATTHIAYVHEDGSIYFPEGTQVLDRHEFDFAAARGRAHRMIRADASDRAEGDGKAGCPGCGQAECRNPRLECGGRADQ